MNRIVWILTVMILTSGAALGQTKYKKVVPCEGIKVNVPKGFVEMREEDIAQRYVTPKKPTRVYTDESMEVDFDINVTRNFWNMSDLDLLKDFYKSSIYNGHKRVKFIKEEVVTINKREYVWLEYTSAFPHRGGSLVKHYTVILFTVLKDRILVFSYRCPQNRMENWKEVAHTSLNSIKISKSLKVDKLLEQEVKGDELQERQTEEDNKESKPEQKVSPRPNFDQPGVDPEKRIKEEGVEFIKIPDSKKEE